MESNTLLRIVSTLVLFALMFLIVFLGDVAFYIAVLVVAVLSYSEWLKITENQGFLLKILGNVVVILPNASMIFIYEFNKAVLMWMLICIWASDIGAYIVGKNIGGPKLCSKISPNKTWSGLLGGLVCAACFSGLSVYFLKLPNPFSYCIFTPLLTLIAILGDLFESGIKRICHVKDSGHLIPGHGGVLDRVDSFIFAAPFVVWLTFFIK